MTYHCMVCCIFPSSFKAAASRIEFRSPRNISTFKFLGQKTSIRGNYNLGLFSVTPIIKRGSLKMTVISASYSPANKFRGGMEEEKGKEMQPKGICLKLVERNRDAWNLGKKLEVIRDLVAENIDNDNRLEALAYSAIYLKWINTGQIPWSEYGVNDAEISKHIFCHLERIYIRKDSSVQEILVIRKIYPCLTSIKAEFTSSIPITRNDDVVHQELEEYFNAGSLEEELESIRDSLDQSSAALPRFLESKQRLDNNKDLRDIAKHEWMTRLMNVLQALDNLRQEIVKGLESEPQNDATDAAIVMRQKVKLSVCSFFGFLDKIKPQLQWRLCEIGLEDYSSVLLSRFLDSLEAVGGACWLAKNVGSWNEPLGALIISIHQLGLSGWKPKECRAIANELTAWQETSLLETEGGEDGTRIWGLRLKATLERADRLTQEYAEALLNILPEKVEMLAEALRILENNVKYTEAEIHAGVVFQASNLCTLVLKAVRKVVGARGWDILVPGTAFGRLIEVENIGSIPSFEMEPLIVVVDKAEGYEEVTEDQIGGVILLQGVPRLSHLLLRARKENIVVMTCEGEEEAFKIRGLRGEVVRLVASSDVAILTPDSSSSVPAFSTLPRNLSIADSTESEPHVKVSEIYMDVLNSVAAVRVEDGEKLARNARVKAENICGARAAACFRLASLAAESIQVVKNDVASFKVPRGAVIPFGSIRGALNRDGAKSSCYWSLIESLEKAASLDDIGALLDKLCVLISSLTPSEEAIIELSKISPYNARLILLSSASVEDLRGMQVAGCDEKYATLSNPDLLRDAVSRVWASLYSPEAFRSRRAARVGERDADMAVLVQEMLSPDLSFVLHIVSPMDKNKVLIEVEMDENTNLIEVVEMDENKDLIEVEIKAENKDMIKVDIAPGLALDTRASPWRLSYDKANGTVETLAFANISEELVVPSGCAADGRLVKLTVDYSKKPLTMDPLYRQQLGRRLGAIGLFLAKKFRGRWDIEGCLDGDDIYIVQMRPRSSHNVEG